MQDTPAVRASISFPPALYGTLEGLAKAKKVSLAWVVRDAAERYVAYCSPGAGRSVRRCSPSGPSSPKRSSPSSLKSSN